MRRPALPSGELTIFGLAVLAAAILVLYPIWGLLREAVVGVEGPVLEGFLNVLREPRVLQATWNSLQVSVGTTVVAGVVGLGLAVVVSRTNTPLAQYMESVGTLPLLTMPFVGGIAWTLLAAPRAGFLNVMLRSVLGLPGDEGPLHLYSMTGLVVVMGLYYSPYIFVLVSGALRSVDSAMEEAARLGGARPWQVVRYVTVPVVTPAIVAGSFLTFTLSAGQFGIPSVIGIPARIEVLPTVIYAKAQTYPMDLAELTGIGLILLAMTGGALVLQRWWLGRRVYETVAGKGARAGPVDLGPWKYLTLALTLFYLVAVVILPFAALLYASFLPYSTTAIRPDLLTLKNYSDVFRNPVTWRSFQNSAILSVTAATLALGVGLVLSYITTRTRARGRGLVQFMSMIPLGVPSMVLSVGVLAAWIRPPVVLYGSLAILVVAYAGHFLPTATQSATAGLMQVTRELEDAARVSGARWPSMMRYVLVPLVRRSLVAGWLLLLITMFREMSASVLLYTPGREVVSVALLNLWEAGSYNPVAAFSTVVVALSLVAFLVAQSLTGWRQGTRQ